ncbi:MAG: signal peptidase I [Propioniciclava sp.]|uniref:signal peptidase I n=1 Tax=Propioniciclava sp. TaxID=2038686 RepID=UPI0039E471BC
MAEEKRGSGIGGFLKEVTIVVVGALIASTLLRLFLLQVFSIPSRSMESTLNVSDRVAVQKVAPFQRGDVVVFRDHLEWLGNPDRNRIQAWQEALVFVGLLPDASTNHLVKRVIGVEGDHVVCCDASERITVNGVALDETEYLYRDPSGGQDAPSVGRFDVIVPKGRLWVMGDHRSASADSRCHLDESVAGVAAMGAFPAADAVVGAAAFTLFPFDRWRGYSTPAAFDSVPASSAPAPEKPVVAGGDGTDC